MYRAGRGPTPLSEQTQGGRRRAGLAFADRGGVATGDHPSRLLPCRWDRYVHPGFFRRSQRLPHLVGGVPLRAMIAPSVGAVPVFSYYPPGGSVAGAFSLSYSVCGWPDAVGVRRAADVLAALWLSPFLVRSLRPHPTGDVPARPRAFSVRGACTIGAPRAGKQWQMPCGL